MSTVAVNKSPSQYLHLELAWSLVAIFRVNAPYLQKLERRNRKNTYVAEDILDSGEASCCLR